MRAHISVVSGGSVAGTATRPRFRQSTIPSPHLHWAGHKLPPAASPPPHSGPGGGAAAAAPHCSSAFCSSTILAGRHDDGIFSLSYLGSIHLRVARVLGAAQRARGARVSWSRIHWSLQSHCSWLCSSLRLWRRGSSVITSAARLLRLLVWRVRETSWGSPEKPR